MLLEILLSTFLNFSQKGKASFKNALDFYFLFLRPETGFKNFTPAGSLIFYNLKILLFFLNIKQ